MNFSLSPIRMRKISLLLFLLPFCISLFAFSHADLQWLDDELMLSDYYRQRKRETIAAIQNAELTPYERLLALTTEYESYSYDTATLYLGKLIDEATILNDPRLLAQAQIKSAFLFLSSGLFKESADVLEDLQPATLDSALRAEYHIHYARLLYDMADYAQGQISATYLEQGHRQSDLALQYISTRPPLTPP